LGVGFGIWGLQVLFGGIWLGEHALQLSLRRTGVSGVFWWVSRGPGSERRLCGDDVMAKSRVRPQFLGWLGAMGRMSLTVYLSQSLLLNLIFGAWGLGLYENVPYWSAVVISMGVTTLLALLAVLWLRRFPQGPMEKLLTGWSKLFVPRTTGASTRAPDSLP